MQMNEFNELKGIVLELKDRYLQEKEKNAGLEEEVNRIKKELETQKTEHDQLKEQLERLRLVNSMLGGSEAPKDAKIRINKIVREIDKCIALLNK
jgi:seryl-tRNA synthetase